MTPAERIRTGRAKPWLPPSAMATGLAERALAPVVDRWSSAWFPRGKLRLEGPLRPLSVSGGDWTVSRSGIALSMSAGARVSVAGLLLGEALDPAKLKAPDRRLADELARRCADDLGARLAETFDIRGLEPSQPGSPAELGDAWHCSIRPEAGPAMIRLAVASDLLVPLIRRSAPQERTRGALSSLQLGLDDQVVTLSALLGRCRVSLQDLTTLEAGDVICLDGKLDQSASLAIDYAPGAASCRIEQDGGALQLRLVE
jgi:flagellar motor switch/type III secretory pathway protein FliN